MLNNALKSNFKQFSRFKSYGCDLYRRGMICTALAVKIAHTRLEDEIKQKALVAVLEDFIRIGDSKTHKGYYHHPYLGKERDERDSSSFRSTFKVVMDKLTAAAEKGEK